jgi:hypothetical protein
VPEIAREGPLTKPLEEVVLPSLAIPFFYTARAIDYYSVFSWFKSSKAFSTLMSSSFAMMF